jgi:hypothetical protein
MSNCQKCKHFYITWDERAPRGCKLYGIKTMSYPGLIVKAYGTAADCMGFEEKPKKIKQDENSKARNADPDFHF